MAACLQFQQTGAVLDVFSFWAITSSFFIFQEISLFDVNKNSYLHRRA
jgi:hypothetical protein